MQKINMKVVFPQLMTLHALFLLLTLFPITAGSVLRNTVNSTGRKAEEIPLPFPVIGAVNGCISSPPENPLPAQDLLTDPDMAHSVEEISGEVPYGT